MKYRKLRIAWSVFWGVVSVLLVVSWVRSYGWMDNVNLLGHDLTSVRGQIAIDDTFTLSANDKIVYVGGNYPFRVITASFSLANVTSTCLGGGIAAPHLIVVVLFGGFAIAPWVRQVRFSLRTLLIGTTLVAIALGLIVWAVKS